MVWKIPSQTTCVESRKLQESCAIAKMTARCALYKWIEWAVAEICHAYGHSKLSNMAACRQLGFDVTGNCAIDLPTLKSENPTLEPNMKCIGSPVADIWPFAYLGAYGTPILGGGGQRWHYSKERWWFPIGSPLCSVTVALSVTMQPQFAIECLRRSNQQGVGHFGPSVPHWSTPPGSAESEHPRLTNGEIISKNSNLCDHNSQSTNVTDGRTDGQTYRRHAIARPRFALTWIVW